MFTSRAEYRLLLRQDNADQRLSKLGHEIGLLSERCFKKYLEKERAIESEINRLETTRDNNILLSQILKRPEVSYYQLPKQIETINPEVSLQVEIQLKYAGYIARQESEVGKFRKMEDRGVPAWLNYDDVPNLRSEARIKLKEIQPKTLGQASRISGVSPADINILVIWIKRGASKKLETMKG
jgi:tRNA uridine 5-carboxymethylaminomethyl modification enzyme